jgi:peptidoglycan/LPS O-acetylase OafA/YrhL
MIPVPSHRNNFGLLRLFFALLVIVSHSFDMVDGDNRHTSLFGTLSFGALAVDGFFVISGYLVTQSLANSRSFADYLTKRIRRIYPGFFAAYLVCLAIVAPLAGGDFSAIGLTRWLKLPLHMLFPDQPGVPGAFDGLKFPLLNGAIWTIPYEFRCYLMLAVVWLLFKGSKSAAMWSAAFTALLLIVPAQNIVIITGEAQPMLRFVTVFIAGSLFYVFRDRIRYTNQRAAFSAVMLLILLRTPLADAAFSCSGAI